MITFLTRKSTSTLALAIALATGSAVVATAVMPVEAAAQRNRDRDRGESSGGGFSDQFIGAYGPLEDAMADPAADLSPLRSRFTQIATIATTNDEKDSAGRLLLNAGIRLQDQSMQLLGLENMIAGGKLPLTEVARFHFNAYQLANAVGDLPKARSYLQNAINYNFSTETVTPAALQITMAENYFASGEYAEGFTYFDNAISQQKSRGQEVDERWYRRGLSVAYNNNLTDKVYDVAIQWLGDYPNDFSWRETINITRNLNQYEGGEILDLLRLARKVNALQEESDYDYYVEAADPRRLPQEVTDVIREGQAAGVITPDNLFISESLETASGRIEADRADLPALESDANAPDATLRTVGAAGDAFLSVGEYAKAAGFYQRTLGMPGVDTNEELTRLGIAQVGAEDYEAARQSFSQVQGNRVSIARLWIAYVDQQTKVEAPSLQDLLG